LLLLTIKDTSPELIDKPLLVSADTKLIEQVAQLLAVRLRHGQAKTDHSVALVRHLKPEPPEEGSGK
jgi:hypothetical protein